MLTLPSILKPEAAKEVATVEKLEVSLLRQPSPFWIFYCFEFQFKSTKSISNFLSSQFKSNSKLDQPF